MIIFWCNFRSFVSPSGPSQQPSVHPWEQLHWGSWRVLHPPHLHLHGGSIPFGVWGVTPFHTGHNLHRQPREGRWFRSGFGSYAGVCTNFWRETFTLGYSIWISLHTFQIALFGKWVRKWNLLEWKFLAFFEILTNCQNYSQLWILSILLKAPEYFGWAW